MHARFLPLLFLGWSLFSNAAIPTVSVSRTGTLFFAASGLTTNGVPGLSNAAHRAVVSDLPLNTERGGQLALVNTQVWMRGYGSPRQQQDGLLDVDVMPSGRVVVTGNSFFQNYDVVTVVYDSEGLPLWTNRFDSPSHSHDYASFVRSDSGSNVFVVAHVDSNDAAEGTVIIKYAMTGEALWTNSFPQFTALGAEVDSSGDLVLGLSSQASNTNLYLIAKLSALGTPIWTNVFRPSASLFDHLNGMTMDSAGAVVVTGSDYGTIKYSPAGVPLWTNHIELPLSGVPSDLAVDGAGNIIVTGDVWDFGAPSPPARFYRTVKFSPSGAALWTNQMPPATYQGGGVPLVRVAPNGEMVIVGATSNSSISVPEFTLTKLNADGGIMWTNLFRETNAAGLNVSVDATMDSAGGFWLMTSSSGPTLPILHFLAVKFDARGKIASTQRFESTHASDDLARCIRVDAVGNAYIGGITGGLFGGGDFALVKYADSVRYIPPPNFVGADSFPFVATETAGNRATNTVNITVTAESLWFNPLLSDWNIINGARRLHLDGATGMGPVILSASSNLVNWASIATNMPVNGAVAFQVPVGGIRQFYRAAQVSAE